MELFSVVMERERKQKETKTKQQKKNKNTSYSRTDLNSISWGRDGKVTEN